MAVAKWATPGSRSSDLDTADELGSLANATESDPISYNNSSNRNLYGAVTLKLGSITPSTGGAVTLRVTVSDGTDAADQAAGDLYTAVLLSGASAKVVIFPMVRLYPFSLNFSIVNNSGVTFNSADNAIYVTPYNEDVS